MADPPIRIVSKRSEAELAKRNAREALDYPLRLLAANILRIVRGAGKPHYLMQQMSDVAVAFDEYHNAHGYYPGADVIQVVLNYEKAFEEARPWVKERQQAISKQVGNDVPDDLNFADHVMVRGALQLAASMLVNQLTQATAGEDELHRGIEYREKAIENRRKIDKRIQTALAKYPAPKERPVLRYSDGRPVVVGRNKKKPPGDEPGGDIQL